MGSERGSDPDFMCFKVYNLFSNAYVRAYDPVQESCPPFHSPRTLSEVKLTPELPRVLKLARCLESRPWCPESTSVVVKGSLSVRESSLGAREKRLGVREKAVSDDPPTSLKVPESRSNSKFFWSSETDFLASAGASAHQNRLGLPGLGDFGAPRHSTSAKKSFFRVPKKI